jgi:protein-S-isoprenylcysteine O-methyltransferase
LGCILGAVGGFHAAIWLLITICLVLHNKTVNSLISHDRLVMIWQWSAYAIGVCIFHWLEFFVTALYNPQVCSSDSYLINHSTGYTAAMLTSWAEFVVRWIWFPHFTFLSLSLCGLCLLVASQVVRSWAMITAQESFNHMIQTRRKENHILITHGIYRYLRHPSYVGFFYWSMATQIVLGNWLHAVVLTAAAWTFFSRRIPYEEDSLCKLFPEEYPEYKRTTMVGIPFIKTM